MTTRHRIQREGDEYACSCGLRWGLDDIDPHELTFGRNDAIQPAPKKADPEVGRKVIEQLKKDLAG